MSEQDQDYAEGLHDGGAGPDPGDAFTDDPEGAAEIRGVFRRAGEEGAG